MSNDKVILLLDDGRAGHLHQSAALAASLIKAQIRTSTDNYNSRTRIEPVSLAAAEALITLPPASLLIGCGRRAAACSLALKKRFGSSVNSIQILNPVVSKRALEHNWDWLLIPMHDYLQGPNIINFLGSLVTTPPPLSRDNSRLVLLLGGATDYLSWDESSLNNWLEQAQQQSMPVTVCCSRRTPRAIVRRLRAWSMHASDHSLVESDDADGYRKALACAAEFWVSGDSINMLAEACASDRPVRVLGAESARGKLQDYIHQLNKRGRFEKNSVPIREAERVAIELIERGALLGLE
ncbi:MAG: mitochondrial fission ELM1 family protein [Xanthomonadales bacterium]|nr:mitochondrial fission ELM1 family protein [Xanthomonadales bacterium]